MPKAAGRTLPPLASFWKADRIMTAGMRIFRVFAWFLVTFAVLSPSWLWAQFVSDVNGLFENARAFNGYPQSTLTITNNYPTTAIIDEQNLGQEFTFFANRHDLLFSSDGGSTRRIFGTADSFDISVELTLEATFDLKRKEAGFRLNKNGFDGQFIVNSDINEIVAFGGPLPFYSFNVEHDIEYTVGTPINLRMIYNAPDAMDPEMFPGTMQYLVAYGGNEYTSGELEFTNSEKGILTMSQIGVYAQGGAEAAHPDDDYTATFTNFVFGEGLVDVGLPGDFNNDQVVDAADYTVWRNNLGTNFDLNGNGDENGDSADFVDAADYALWKSSYGTGGNGSAGLGGFGVPEPATVSLIGLGLVGLFGIRRRSK
jgi:hypothetical protein